MKLAQFRVRDLLLIGVAVVLAVGWWAENRRHVRALEALRHEHRQAISDNAAKHRQAIDDSASDFQTTLREYQESIRTAYEVKGVMNDRAFNKLDERLSAIESKLKPDGPDVSSRAAAAN